MGEEGLVLMVPRAELSPFEALMNFPPRLGQIGIAAGLRGGGGDLALCKGFICLVAHVGSGDPVRSYICTQ